MPCYSPLDCWRQPGALKPGEKRIVFSKHDAAATPLTVPCGQCIGCRLERSRRWAVRLMHESKFHDRSSFLTLTYDNDNVPSNGSLNKRDFQLFFKRLRRGSSSPLKYFHCGEYGDINLRPHYHVCLFGDDFSSDREFEKRTFAGDRLYTSQRLSEVWGKGHCWIGDLTFESAAYVARYCLKKVNNKHSYTDKNGVFRPSISDHYGDRIPEYVTMSQGIGRDWFQNFFTEAYPSDSIVMRGKEMLPPPFYDKLLEKVDPALFNEVKSARNLAAKSLAVSENTSSRRLLDRRIVKEQTVDNCLKRKL